MWPFDNGLLGQGGLSKLNRAKQAENLYGGVDPTGEWAAEAGRASQFGQQGAGNYRYLGAQGRRDLDYLRSLQRGEQSVSAEQLRQGLAQNVAGQQAMAASAAPGMAPMAARNAAMNAARMGSGMAGQQAVAGLAERQQAAQALQQYLLSLRQQELQATLQGQQNAMAGYGGIEANRTQRYGALMGAPTPTEQILGAGTSAAALAAKTGSDRRLKKDIEPGDEDAEKFLKALKSYRFKYKAPKEWGEGKRLGIMAQDLEKSGLGKQAVIDTPAGKVIHSGGLATALAATLPTLHKRLEKLEARGR